MEKLLKKHFIDVQEKSFINSEGFHVKTNNCRAVIAIGDNEIIMSEIFSNEKGGGSEMLNKLEEISRIENKDFIVSNIINSKLKKMVEKRGYIRQFRPFAPERGIFDVVEIYRKVMK